MSQLAPTLSDLTPFERSLIRAYRGLRASRPSQQAVWAALLVFTLNVVAMAASSGSRMGFTSLLVISALQASVVTPICIAPGILAYAFGFTRRVPHRWAVLVALFLAAGSLS